MFVQEVVQVDEIADLKIVLHGSPTGMIEKNTFDGPVLCVQFEDYETKDNAMYSLVHYGYIDLTNDDDTKIFFWDHELSVWATVGETQKGE